MKSVALEHVSVRFGKLAALSDVSVSLAAGEVVMLVGPNGAGKSSLIRVLLGLLRPDAGTMRVDGAEESVDHAFKSALGYLPEAVAFADNLSGREVIGFFARARGVPRSHADAVLQRVGLTHAAKRAVRTYSRGMRQRLGLGIAILATPPLLVLDEPTGGLDQEGLDVLWSVLQEWRQAGRLTLLASHELTLMERRIDRMCVLRAGCVVADDAPSRLRERTALPIRVELTARAEAVTPGQLAEHVRGTGGALPVAVRGDLVEALVEPRGLLALLDRCGAAQGVANVRVVEPGLDDVYQRLLEGG